MNTIDLFKYLLSFLLSFSLSLLIIPFIIRFANRFGFIAEPKEDRWHKTPVALLGGVGIFISFIVSFIVFLPQDKLTIAILICSFMVFLLGLFDDLNEIKPQTKIIYQIMFATILVICGLQIEGIKHAYIAIPITIIWIVGITNAFNILDNMDGLSSGVAAVSSCCIFFYALENNISIVLFFSAIICGSSLGFLRYNYYPAKIFMGDSGSLFLGFILSVISILSTRYEVSNLLITLIVPLFVMILPIFDSALVTFQRSYHGKSIFVGGKDHASHRLVFLGVSEQKATLILLSISMLFGMIPLFLKKYNVFTFFVVSCILLVCLIFFGVFLGEVRVYRKGDKEIFRKKNLIVTKVLLYKKQILQIIVDTVMVNTAYISSYLLLYEGAISQDKQDLIEISLPFIILIKLFVFYIFGMYRGEWKYVGINDLFSFFKGITFASLCTVMAMFVLFQYEKVSVPIFIVDYLITLQLICTNRIILKFFKLHFSNTSVRKNQTTVLIMGAGDGGELLLREIRNNYKINYKAVGFIDDDLEKKGRIINGLEVLGTRHDIPKIVQEYRIKKVLISILSIEEDNLRDIYDLCKSLKIQCKKIKLMIEC